MSWNATRARQRINRFIGTVPEGDIQVESFTQFLIETRLAKAHLGLADVRAGKALVQIPRNRAITTHAVHVYANLIDFNSVLVDAGRETEASHRRALEFLHTHYGACDTLIDSFELQRVDFHGPRLHAVVLAPEGDGQEGDRVRKAVAFAAAFREMVERLGEDYPEFKTGVRIGIDSGPAVAIDSGKRDESEPLFIGSPANHAAKLAAGSEEGVALSARAQAAMQRPAWGEHLYDMVLAKAAEHRFLDEQVAAAGSLHSATNRLDEAYASFAIDMRARHLAKVAGGAIFHFHRKEPPLKDLVFAEHPPSNAIRMAMASIFADIDGFTDYIDAAIRSGRIAQAVANLHVLRAEMAAVLRDDFDGRKVRFIGDCIHGLLAVGTAFETKPTDTIRAAVMAAGGIRSSFDLCRTILPGIGDLGIAIGIDYGETPICRIGLRGAGSVRAATSRATCVSEAEQQGCDGDETALGQDAYAAAPAAVREVFVADRKVPNLDYDAAQVLLGTMASPYINTAAAEPMRAYQPAEPMRAHNR